MIDFNRQLSGKDLIKIIIPSIFILASIILFFLFTKPLLNENDNLKTDIIAKKEDIESKSLYVNKVEDKKNSILDIEIYDKYIDNITDLLIKKKFISGNITHDKLDPTENLFPCVVNSKLLLKELKDLKYISDALNYNLIYCDAKKNGKYWEITTSNLYAMDKFYGLRDIYINNLEGENIDSSYEEKNNDDNEEDVEKDAKIESKKEISNVDNPDKNKSVKNNFSAFSENRIEDYKEKYVDYNFFNICKEEFVFAPLQEGVNYNYDIKNIKNNDELVINAFNYSENNGTLEIEFTKYNRIIWQDGGKISFNFNSLGGENPNIKLKFIDSHESEVILEPKFEHDKLIFDLSTLQNYPIFLKSFLVNLDAKDRRHFMISNGIISFRQKDVNEAIWTKRLYSAPSFGCRSFKELMTTYNNNHIDNFLINNSLSQNDYLSSPSYIFESKDAYEIFEKD